MDNSAEAPFRHMLSGRKALVIGGGGGGIGRAITPAFAAAGSAVAVADVDRRRAEEAAAEVAAFATRAVGLMATCDQPSRWSSS